MASDTSSTSSTSTVSQIFALKLSGEERQAVGEALSAMIAVNVYRELQRTQQVSAEATSGCNIIGNCSSCSRVN